MITARSERPSRARTPAVSSYAFSGTARSPRLDAFAEELAAVLDRTGARREIDPHRAVLVFNLVDRENATPFRRRSRGTFSAALHEQPTRPPDVLRVNYPLLVRALANVVLCYVPDDGVWFTTMERGNYRVAADDGDAALAQAVIARLAPLASARLVIDNDFRPDLEPGLWDGDEVTEELRHAGARLDALDLLPAPFPVDDLLDERDLRHVKRLYGLGGLSYGNLSARKDAHRFWMSASGVDKGHLQTIGRDILLVAGYDAPHARMILSVPPGVELRRVSVDAIEHWMIYEGHPDVGAILHVHAWVEGIPATELNYPCGTEELATSVAALVAEQPDPAHAIVGLHNHGITVTGSSLTEILDRIEPVVVRQVPMY